MSVLNDLKAARELIAPKTRWIKNEEIGIRGYDNDIDSSDLMELFLHAGLTEKTCFCATGAIKFATKNDEDRYNAAIFALAEVVKDDDEEEIEEGWTDVEGIVTSWNDLPSRTHKQVLAAFDAAINQKTKK